MYIIYVFGICNILIYYIVSIIGTVTTTLDKELAGQ